MTLTDHPSPEDLAALYDGRLTGPAAARTERHLAACARCAALLEELAEFARSDAEAGRTAPADAEVRAALDELLPSLHGRPPGGRRVRTVALVLTALLAVSLLANLLLWQRPGAAPADGSATWSNVQIVDLDAAAGSTRSTAGTPGTRSISAGSGATVLLHGVAADAGDDLTLVLRQRDGPLRLRLHGLRPTPAEYVTVALAPGLLEPDLYELTLHRGSGGDRPLATYELRVAP